MNTHSHYFRGTIEALVTEPKKYLERVSFFKSIERTRDEYYMICSLAGNSENFRLKIKIGDYEYSKSKIGDDVSIHLTFGYDYSCFHYVKEVEIPIIEVN
jgi:hypothetical protein